MYTITNKEGKNLKLNLIRIDDKSVVTSLKIVPVFLPKYAIKRKGFLKSAEIYEIVSSTRISYVAHVDETFSVTSLGMCYMSGKNVFNEFKTAEEALEWIAVETRLNTKMAKVDKENISENLVGKITSIPTELGLSFIRVDQ